MEQQRDDVTRRIKRQYILTRSNLLLERLWSAGGLLFCFLGVFLALTFLGFWEVLHPVLHLIGLIGFVGAIAYSLNVFRMWFRWPDRADILAALESRNGLQHRPIRSLEALPVLDGARKQTSRYLWDLHQKRHQTLIKSAKTGWPQISLADGDKYALRSGMILLLLVGIFVGGSNAGSRLETAFIPAFSGERAVIEVDVWTTPPEYTRLPPQLLVRKILDDSKPEPLLVNMPAGSKIIARVSGGNTEIPELHIDDQIIEFVAVESLNFELEFSLDKSAAVTLEKGGDVLLQWDIGILPDASPVALLTSLPEVTERSAFGLHYSAADDYGVQQLLGRITLQGSKKTINLNLPIVSNAKEVGGKSYHDLTAHPWAGFSVDLVLLAKDAIGQEGFSKSISFTLPERIFSHPIARALIEQRKNLVLDPESHKQNVVIALTAISSLPESLNNDFTVIMMLATARSTLVYGRDKGSVEDVIDILWDTALRLENGDLNAAEIALREAERALMEALNNDASDEEIKRLVEELKQAMNEFLEAFAQNQNPGNQSPTDEEQTVDSLDLERLLDKVDRFARSGARDAARELLSELQDILENLRSATATAPSPAQQAGQEGLNQLDKMMRMQQKLLDETFRESRQNGQNKGQQKPGKSKNGNSPSKESGSYSGLAGRQEALRQMLGDLMGQMGLNGEIPESMGNAERSMNGARQDLELQDGRGAAEAQSNALDQLRQAAEGLARQMMQGSDGQAVSSGQNGQGQDPLGRPLSNQANGHQNVENGFRLQENAISRARLIQNELRRRLSDPSRGKLERDYLRRLMERFR